MIPGYSTPQIHTKDLQQNNVIVNKSSFQGCRNIVWYDNEYAETINFSVYSCE